MTQDVQEDLSKMEEMMRLLIDGSNSIFINKADGIKGTTSKIKIKNIYTYLIS